MIPDDELAAIRARSEAATEGPWRAEESTDTWTLHGGPIGAHQILKAPKRHTSYAEYWPNDADAEFIAHARTDVPRLLIELDQRTEQLEKAWADIAAMAAALVQLEDAQVVIAADNDRLGAELDTARAEVARLTTVKRMLKETVAAVPDAHH